MKKKVLPSKLNLESHVPAGESPSEEVHRRWQEVMKRRSFLKGIRMIRAALSAGSLLSTVPRRKPDRVTASYRPGMLLSCNSPCVRSSWRAIYGRNMQN
jgi:hypothetical protein